MEKNAPRFTLESLARLLEGVVEGPSEKPLERPVSAGDSDPLGVTFAESDKYLEMAEKTEIGAVIVSHDCRPSSCALIRVDSPRAAFGMVLALCFRDLPLTTGSHSTAVVSSQARIHPSASVGAYVVVEKATIGAKAKIYPFCYVGEGCELGESVVLYPHVVLYRDVKLGPRTVVHSGTVIGADGFGYVWDGERRVKVPQAGSVSIGGGVEIGANTTIDRATAGSTEIGEGTKIDNLVQIAHNVTVGEHGVIASQSGISGSTHVGDRVTMGGNVGTTDHVDIVSDVVLGGRSSVDRDITEPGMYFGTPARPAGEAKRSMVIYTKLPELFSRIRELEKKVQDLEEKQ